MPPHAGRGRVRIVTCCGRINILQPLRVGMVNEQPDARTRPYAQGSLCQPTSIWVRSCGAGILLKSRLRWHVRCQLLSSVASCTCRRACPVCRSPHRAVELNLQKYRMHRTRALLQAASGSHPGL